MAEYDLTPTSCHFCWNNNGVAVPAIKIAPQWSGGNENEPAKWLPVCAAHFEDWYEGVADYEMLPAFDLGGR